MDLIDDDPVAQVTGSMPTASGSSSTSASAVAGGLRSSGGASSKLGVDYSTGFGSGTSTVETDAIMKEIAKREVKIRNR